MDNEKTCVLEKIRMNAQNSTTYLGSTVNIIPRTYMIIQDEGNLHFDDEII